MIVMKFGGSSLATVERIERTAGLVKKMSDRQPAVVVSAHGKTTNKLIGAANLAYEGTVDIGEIETLHFGLLEGLGLEREVVAPLLEKLRAVLTGVSLLGELTPRSLDAIMSFGERLSTRVVAAAMSKNGLPAQAVNAFEMGLVTNSAHGNAIPLSGIEADIGTNLAKVHGIPVVTGFLGADKNGHITTLGRGGSDFSATILGAALKAEEVQIWTDVNGVMTCDPSIDKSARNLPVLSFNEASELAYYGAEVLHQNTLIPVIESEIPVRVLNTMNPDDPGTKISAVPVKTERIAKSIVYKEDICLINLESPRLMSAVKLLGTALDRLSQKGVGVHMATTSEATVSMITDRHYADDLLANAVEDLENLGRVSVESRKAIICVIGEELRGQVGVLGAIFTTLSERGIKAKMVSQSGSEINVAFLVENSEIELAVRALHGLLLG
jgi:aspartate kinase